jgi:hypothetical protein
MKITLPDGTTVNAPFPASGGGFIAKVIEMDAADIRAMRTLAGKNPGKLILALRQLEARFEGARIPIAGVAE